MKCELLLVVIFSVIYANCVKDLDDWTCEVKVPLKENYCNSCVCGTDGKLGECTKKNCGRQPRCKYGVEWKRECNKCWCLKPIGILCTDLPCPKEIEN